MSDFTFVHSKKEYLLAMCCPDEVEWFSEDNEEEASPEEDKT